MTIGFRQNIPLAFFPLVFIACAVVFKILFPVYEADPDYAYLFNSLNLLNLKSVQMLYLHPGTTVEMMGAVDILLSWVVTLPWHGFSSLNDDVVAKPQFYLDSINFLFVASNACALFYFARSVLQATGRFVPALTGSATVFLSMPALLALHRVAPEPVILAASLVLMGLLSRVVFASPTQIQIERIAIKVGVALGFCMATKVTSAPLLLIILFLQRAKDRKLAAITCASTALLLTLPVSAHYFEMVSWYIGLFTHTKAYASGDLGVPSWQILFEDVRNLFDQTPETFCFPILYCGVWLWRRARPPFDSISRFLAFAIVIISLGLLLVLKQPTARYLICVVSVMCLANAAVVFLCLQHFRSIGRFTTAVAIGIFCFLGLQRNYFNIMAMADVRRANDTLLKTAFSSDCLVVPYYSINAVSYNLFFGNSFSGENYSNNLKRLYPNFLTFNVWANDFADFAGGISPVEIARQLRRAKCVYLVGSPLERFDPFAIRDEYLRKIARTPGSQAEAIALMALQPGYYRGDGMNHSGLH